MATELVKDNYNFLVSDSAPRSELRMPSFRWLPTQGNRTLLYLRGEVGRPAKVLQASEKQKRFIRPESAAALARPGVEELLAAAIKQAETAPVERAGIHRH